MTDARLNDTLDVIRTEIVHRDYSMPYWEASREKKLVIQYCKVSGRYQHYPRPVSLVTGRRRDIEWREVSGRGSVFSYTIVRRARPPFRDHEPYVEVSIMLEEGINVISNLVHCMMDQLKIGMRVRPYWHPLYDGTHLLMFQPELE
jgi:uncharacterized protein